MSQPWRWLRRGLSALLLLSALSFDGWSQAPENAAAVTPQNAPAVQDESGQPAAPTVAGQPAAEAAQPSLQGNIDKFKSLAQAREEIRRAFVRQDYQRVLTLSQEIKQRYSVDEAQNFYAVAAQLRLAEKQTERAYRRMGDAPPPQLTGPLPSVEKLDETAAAAVNAPAPAAQTATPDTAVAPAPAVETQPPVEVAEGQGDQLIASAMPPPDDAPMPDTPPTAEPEAVVEPAATPAPEATPIAEATPAAEVQVALAVTPQPIVSQPEALPASEMPAESRGLVEKLTIGLVIFGLLSLLLIYAVRARRDREPAEAASSTLDMSVDEAVSTLNEMEAPLERVAEAPMTSPPSKADPLAGLGDFDPSLFEEETKAEPKTETLSKPVTEIRETISTEAAFMGDPFEIDDSLFGPIEPAEEKPAKKETPAKPEPARTTDLDESGLVLEGLDLLQIHEAPAGDAHDIGEPVEDVMARPAIRLDDHPEEPVEKQTWDGAPDAISFDLESTEDLMQVSEPQSLAPISFDLAEEPTQSLVEEPDAFELADTKTEIRPAAPTGIDAELPEVSPFDKTKTNAWEELGLGPEIAGEETIPGLSTTPPPSPRATDRIQAFHADETVDIHLEAAGGGPNEVTLGSAAAAAEAPQTEQSDEQTEVSDRLGLESAEASAGEDLFDREYRLGMDSYNSQDWGSAVHHLSVAAALRPEDSKVKEVLREARRHRRAE